METPNGLWDQGLEAKESVMGVFDKAKERTQQWVGKAKQATGHATGNDELSDAGKRDEVAGEAKETGHDVKDKAAGTAKNMKDRLRGDQEK